MENNKGLWTKNFIIINIINLLIFFSFQMLLPTLPLYAEKLGGTNSIIGLVTGLFVTSAVVIRPFSGLLLDKLGRKKIFLIGLLLFILSVFSYSLFPILIIILMIRFIHGFGWGITSTASSTIASDNIPKDRFGEGMGYFSLTSSLAMALAPAVGLFIISKYKFNVLFYISTALAILALIITSKLEYRDIENKEKVDIKNSLYEKTSVRPSIIIFFVTITYGALTSFLPIYASQNGIENIGIFFTVYATFLFISRPIFGKIIDKLGFDYAVIPGLAFVTIAMVLLSRATNLNMFLITALIYGIGFGATQSSLQTMSIAGVSPARLGAANATFLTAFDCGIGLGSIFLGMISSIIGYSQMYLLAGGFAVLAFILYFIIGRQK
ncbi:major facilitator transporter [Gottschalkia acidurici 9a]|uniref:Major facilitator transporter n=1 Tax=Gottschalkia acidurici (strain ATCC 7906 / DSM 604 / BCRC 14475 / CIP 104303 / KCTC 5404 / NCIMB 10678 / 9a) TaxID=1128398 RepID=K0AYF0_GOTA9|nr:MFS transporter [Gottschalkia acidurici]AFS78289.1 major facilitator transporter [Gottschalkia acidurici 9a]